MKLACLLILALSVSARRHRGPKLERRTPLATFLPKHETLQGSAIYDDEPAYLTPLINSRRIADAQAASSTKLLGTQGYSGFLTVNESCGSNLFFWYFPATNVKKEEAPLLLWLQGGPGGSSMFGLFEENGPYKIIGSPSVQDAVDREEGSWSGEQSVVYIDNPVGTGFSFTRNASCYATNQDDVGRDLYSFFQQFYKLFPYLQRVPFYATGESYAGKYVPAIAHAIHVENKRVGKTGNIKIPLAGMAIGDGISDPIVVAGFEMMQEYAPLLYYTGLVDENERDTLQTMFARAAALYTDGARMDAFKVFDEALNGDVTPYPSYFTNCTGGSNYFNYLKTSVSFNLSRANSQHQETVYQYWLNAAVVRQIMHTGSLPYNNGTVVEKYMLGDFLAPVTPWVVELLNAGYKTLFYNGNLDIIVGTPLTERFLWGLDWKHADDYRTAKKKVWKVAPSDPEVAGYVRKAGNLWQVAVRNAGHILPRDQPRAALDLLRRFINDAF